MIGRFQIRATSLAVLVAGCSWATQAGPPERPAASVDDPACDEDSPAPIVDGVMLAVMYSATLGLLGYLMAEKPEERDGRIVGGVAAGFGVATYSFGHSFKRGILTAEACAEWKEAARR